MRLIDADAFAEILANRMEIIAERYGVFSSEAGILSGAYKLLQSQPTIEPRKKGTWIVTSKFEDCYYAKCNECKVTQVFYYNKALTNYCPNCGAQMRGGEE